VLPSRPELPQGNPEELIRSSKSWLGVTILQNGKLLPEGEYLKKQGTAGTDRSSEQAK
jgi:hypothetical protein